MEMKLIDYRGGVLKFRIPKSWNEEYSDIDGGTFYEDGDDTGTLRVKITTLEVPSGPAPVSAEKLIHALLKHPDAAQSAVQYIGNNGLLRYDAGAEERGTQLRISYWVFANPVGKKNARVVTFSYTVLERTAHKPEVLSELEMLDAEIRRTEFSPRLGAFY